MATINNYFEQTQLAQAAYANLQGITGKPLTLGILQENNALGYAPNFSSSQEAEFWKHYAVVDSQPNTNLHGFSATLFQNVDTGEYTLAMRGTEPSDPRDLLEADYQGIARQGMATYQIVDLYNYHQRLITPAGQLVDQWVLIEPSLNPAYVGLTKAPSATGLGKLMSSTKST